MSINPPPNQPTIDPPEPPEQPSLLAMVAIVAVIVALVILLFSGIGYALGKFIF
jgi:hypothetical protein